MADWTTILGGRVYRPAMRLMHRFGWCYPVPVAVEPGLVWCHWCGMRGRRAMATGGIVRGPGHVVREGECR